MSDQKVHWHHDGPALNRSLLVEQEEQGLVDARECTYPRVIKGKEEGSSQWLDSNLYVMGMWSHFVPDRSRQ